jgi:hypothetical protein
MDFCVFDVALFSQPFVHDSILICTRGANSLRSSKILSQGHLFLSFLLSPFLPCKDIFMDDYDGIYNCNSLKYSPFENFDNF